MERPGAAIAIVGIGCRLPGGIESPESFVELLKNRGEGVTPVPTDFDPAPFGLSGEEARALDPGALLLLEAAYDAIEDAGLRPSRLRDTNTGTYVCASSPRSSVSGLCERVAQAFGFLGPVVLVEGGSGSSLAAVHDACRALAEGVTDLALAGGVDVLPSWDDPQNENGTALPVGSAPLLPEEGRASGVALVVLKRLADAQRDADRVYAVVLASACEADERGQTPPVSEAEAQARLYQTVVRRAAIGPHRVAYAEVACAGARAFDLSEVVALTRVYCGGSRGSPLRIGSTKSNVARLDAAAGVAGLIKAALSLHERCIFPLGRSMVRHAVCVEELAVAVPLTAEPWPELVDLTVAVSSFGGRGVNAHAILRAAEPAKGAREEAQAQLPRVAVFSAFDEGTLRARAAQLLDRSLDELPDALSALAHDKDQLSNRAYVWADDESDLRGALAALAVGRPHARAIMGRAFRDPRVLLLYTGTGSEWPAMGRRLLETSEIFREAAREADAVFRGVSGWSIVDELLRDEHVSRVRECAVAQPATFLLQVALTALLRHHGVRASGVLGHGASEVTAAWASGCLTLETACRIVFHRSELQQRLAGRGGRAILDLSLDEARSLVRRFSDVSVAAVNGQSSIDLAGGTRELEIIVDEVERSGRFAELTEEPVAYHSHHMDALEGAFKALLGSVPCQRPTTALYSTTRGTRIFGAEHDVGYWWENTRRPVLLREALRAAFQDGYELAVEIGPHPTHVLDVRDAALEAKAPLRTIAAQLRNVDGADAFNACLGNLYTHGATLELETIVPKRPTLERVRYPFQRRRA
jgi:acyl transferase domain-containing protein